MIKKILIAIAVLIVPIVLIIYLGSIELFTMKFFGVKKENIRREIFKETRSYNEGKIQQLGKYRFEYLQSDPESKQIIASTVRHSFADFNCEELPIELKQFLRKIRGY